MAECKTCVHEYICDCPIDGCAHYLSKDDAALRQELLKYCRELREEFPVTVDKRTHDFLLGFNAALSLMKKKLRE